MSSRRFDPLDPCVTQALLLGVAACAFFSIAVMQILMAAAYAHWITSRLRRDAPPLRAPLALPMAGFLLVSLASAIRIGTFDCVRDVGSTAFTAGVYLMTCNVFTSAASARRAACVVALAGTAVALLGLSQSWSAGGDLRIAGTHSHYYTYSGVVALACGMTMAWVVLGARRGWRAVFAVAVLLMAAALLQTQTRSAAVACSLSAAIVSWVWKPRSLLLLPAILALGYFVSPAHIQDRIRSTADPQNDTVMERYEMWSNGLAIWRDHFWLGVGPERVSEYYDDYRDHDSPIADHVFPGRIHNSAIQLAAERGVFGVAFWLLFWIAWTVRTLRHLARVRAGPPTVRAVVCGALAALAAFQVMGVFECNVSDSEVATLSYILLALPLGLEALLPRRAEEPLEPAAQRP